jgi:hypothetical protein
MSLPRAVTVPRGFVTDLATIPVYFWWAIKPTGRHGHAAILHDWLYWEQGSVSSTRAQHLAAGAARAGAARPLLHNV